MSVRPSFKTSPKIEMDYNKNPLNVFRTLVSYRVLTFQRLTRRTGMKYDKKKRKTAWRPHSALRRGCYLSVLVVERLFGEFDDLTHRLFQTVGPRHQRLALHELGALCATHVHKKREKKSVKIGKKKHQEGSVEVQEIIERPIHDASSKKKENSKNQ